MPANRAQRINTARLAIIYTHLAVMHGVHLGMGSTIGRVISTVGAQIDNVRGKGNAKRFCSYRHGTGRVMRRSTRTFSRRAACRVPTAVRSSFDVNHDPHPEERTRRGRKIVLIAMDAIIADRASLWEQSV